MEYRKVVRQIDSTTPGFLWGGLRTVTDRKQGTDEGSRVELPTPTLVGHASN